MRGLGFRVQGFGALLAIATPRSGKSPLRTLNPSARVEGFKRSGLLAGLIARILPVNFDAGDGP